MRLIFMTKRKYVCAVVKRVGKNGDELYAIPQEASAAIGALEEQGVIDQVVGLFGSDEREKLYRALTMYLDSVVPSEARPLGRRRALRFLRRS
jgi:hypothetical protein